MTAVTIALVFGVPVLSFLASYRFAHAQERKLAAFRGDDGVTQRVLDQARERRRDMLTDEYARCIAAARRLGRIPIAPIVVSDSYVADAVLDLEASADMIHLLAPASVTSALASVIDQAQRPTTLQRSSAPSRVLRSASSDLNQIVDELMQAMLVPAAGQRN